LPVVLYVCEIWTLKERTYVESVQNRVLRETFGLKRDEIIVG
jgi:hypothetical protein